MELGISEKKCEGSNKINGISQLCHKVIINGHAVPDAVV
jgi:hypothetical protein